MLFWSNRVEQSRAEIAEVSYQAIFPQIEQLPRIMEAFFDEYDYYNFDENVINCHARKGRTKKECCQNTNRFNPGGHERKMVEKLRNTERNRNSKEKKASHAKKPNLPENWSLISE